MKLMEMYVSGLLTEQEFFELLEEGAFYGDLQPVMDCMDRGQRYRFERWKTARLARSTGLAA